MRKSLVAFDTNQITSYVFGTDRLKEIRGGSARLDELNREGMIREIKKIQQKLQGKVQFEFDPIYVNGGSGLFVIVEEEIATGKTDQQRVAEMFGQAVRRLYWEETQEGASVTYIVHELPGDLPDNIEKLKRVNLSEELKMVRYLLREARDNPSDLDIITLPSHPFLRPCDSCGINYAQHKAAGYGNLDDQENSDDTGHYCATCYRKQQQNNKDKKVLRKFSRKSNNDPSQNIHQKGLWQRILYHLDQADYSFKFPQRPKDFNVFREFVEGKEYLGLIYADANNMGARLEKLETLNEHAEFAREIDDAIHIAMSKAISKHLPITPKGSKKTPNLFPFDILLLGGDDIVMATDASKAMEVAYTIAKEFYTITQKSTKIKEELKPCTLSIGVALAPIKYPFSLLLDIAVDALEAAKKESWEAHTKIKGKIDDSRINFMVVTGGSIKNFDSVDNNVYRSTNGDNEFYATLRPYDLEGLNRLLTAIKEGHRRNLGRTKLHALREAVLEKNLTTSVSHGLAVLRNWREEQRKFALASLYEFGGRTIPRTDLKDPENGFPRITFPWFVDQTEVANTKREVYRTAFLDFVELFDFVATDREEERE